MTRNISRRTLAKGAAWATPVVLATAAVPAYAASACTIEAMKVIDSAFDEIIQTGFVAYWSEPSDLLADGFSKVPTFNIINNTKYEVVLSGSEGISVKFDAVRANGSTGLPNGPTSTATSWGANSSVTTNATVNGQQARTWTWNAAGTDLWGNVKGKQNYANTNFSTGSNIFFGGVKVLATLLEAPVVAPSFDSIIANSTVDLSKCAEYYAQKVAAQPKISITFAGPLFSTGGGAAWNNNGNTNTLQGGSQLWTVGSSIWSTASGNYVSDIYPPRVASKGSTNGIF